MSRNRILSVAVGILAAVVLLHFPRTVTAWQEEEPEAAKKPESTVTVRGQLVVADADFEFEIKGMPVVLDEFMTPPKLPLPKNYADMTQEERQEWYGAFIESEAGKAYIAKVEALQEQRHYQETEADEDGRFAFKDVPRSSFGLYGQKKIQNEGKTYLAEFQAEFPIGEKLDFIQLDRLSVIVRRLLQVGEIAPDLVLNDDDEKENKVQLSKFRGKHLLIYFWTVGSAEYLDEQVKQAHEAGLDLKIVGVNLNPPGDELDSFLKENPTPWETMVTAGLDGSPLTVDYSITQLPSLWLVGPDGKIKATDLQFFLALEDPEADLAATLKKVISGELVLPDPEE